MKTKQAVDSIRELMSVASSLREVPALLDSDRGEHIWIWRDDAWEGLANIVDGVVRRLVDEVAPGSLNPKALSRLIDVVSEHENAMDLFAILGIVLAIANREDC